MAADEHVRAVVPGRPIVAADIRLDDETALVVSHAKHLAPRVRGREAEAAGKPFRDVRLE